MKTTLKISEDFNIITGNGKQSVSWKCIIEVIHSISQEMPSPIKSNT